MVAEAVVDKRLIESIDLAHTSAESIAFIGAFMVLFGCREEDGCLWRVSLLYDIHISEWVDKAATSLIKESANSSIGVQSFRFGQAIHSVLRAHLLLSCAGFLSQFSLLGAQELLILLILCKLHIINLFTSQHG